MERNRTIHIDTDKACSKCGEMGATPNGLCLRCIGKLMGKERVCRKLS